MTEAKEDSFEAWLAHGAAEGWISLPVCITHSSFPTREWEELALIQGIDPCMFVMRLWKDGFEDLTDEQAMQLMWDIDET